MSTRQQLTDRYLDLYAQAYRLLHDVDDAKDAVQEALVNTLARFHILRDPYAYCSRVLRNCCLEMLRHRRKLEPMDESCYLIEVHTSAETKLQLQELQKQIPAEVYPYFVLHEIDGYTIDEIAAMSGKKRHQIREMLNRARSAITKSK